MAQIALFNPGEMGSAVGAALVARGHRVWCALEGRSEATRHRAARAGLTDAATVPAAVSKATVVLSICPPHAALDVARSVARAGFKGLFVDGNAISPDTAREVAAVVEGGGARTVDAGIFGSPPSPDKPGKIHFSGTGASEAAGLFEGSCVHTSVMPGPIGAASALKACYAAWTKGTWLHLANIYATAQQYGVEEGLREEWSRSHPELLKQLAAPSLNPAKAWRWLAEMREIAATFEAVGMPGGAALAGEAVCQRLQGCKDDASRPSIEKVAGAVRRSR